MLNDPDKRQLDRALLLIREVLDVEVVGAYLFGSAVQGGLRPDSDLDIFVVSKRPTTLSEKERLVRGLMPISGRITPEETWRRVEVTIVVHSDVTPWRYPPVLDFQYGDWLRPDFEMGIYEPSPPPFRPDLALLIRMVVTANTALLGPLPDCIFDTVPQADILRAMISDIDRLRDDIDSDTRNVILTLARMWSTFSTGDIRSKDAAANWVLERLPSAHHPILARSRDAYLGRLSERWDDLSHTLAPCIDYMIAEIKRLAVASSVQT